MLNLVLATEHVVDLGQVVSARDESLNRSLRLETALEVGLLAQVAHLVVDFRGNGAAGVEAVLQVDLLGELFDAAAHAQREHGRRQAGAVGEDADALALQLAAGDVGDEGDERAVHAAAIHVAAHSGDLD